MLKLVIECENVQHAIETLQLLGVKATTKVVQMLNLVPVAEQPPVAEPDKPKRGGRRAGSGRKAKPAADAGTVAGDGAGDITATGGEKAEPAAPASPPSVSPAPAPRTKEQPISECDPAAVAKVQAAIQAVHGAKGFEATWALLARFGVERGRDLFPSQVEGFVKAAQATVDGAFDPVAGKQ